MSDLDTRLAAALNADAPPRRDAVFRVDVLVRLEQARFRRNVQRTMVVAMLAAVLAFAGAPGVAAWVAADAQGFWLVVVGAAVTLCVMSVVLIVPRFRHVASNASRLLYP